MLLIPLLTNIEIVHSTTAKAVIPKLDRTFVAYGVPEVVKTDNGRSFNGHEFAQFADYLGFVFRKVTPLWPEANGEVERFMRCFGKVLRTTTNRKQQMYHPTPLIVTDKNQSMLTVEGPNWKVTRNSSHFKRFLTGEPITSFLIRLRNLLLMWTWQPGPLSSAPTSCQKFADPGPTDPTDCAEISTEGVLRRSIRLPKPTKGLIQGI